jgi:nucleoside-diphosphate-sugar epimerase
LLKLASDARTLVLVTGASGKIGKYVVAELAERGYAVRALTTKSVEVATCSKSQVEWLQFDWHQSLAFAPLLEGCAAVLHLGADMRQVEKMQRSNVEVTQNLARAAEDAGVKFFCYVSSVAVYGSSLSAIVTEDSPVLTCDRDVRSEYMAADDVRAYGRTKLAGELKIREQARTTDYVILRPTVVVEVADLVALGTWGYLDRVTAGYRHSQRIFVLDVVHAILWFMERSLTSNSCQPSVNVYNLADDDSLNNTYADFFRKAYLLSSDRRFKPVQLPRIFDGLKDALKFLRDALKYRMLPVRHSLSRMRFSTEALYATGYRHRYGIQELHRRALDSLVTK